MNLKSLSNEAMLSLSGFLVEDPIATALLGGQKLGAAALEQMCAAHDLLAGAQKRRDDNERAIEALSQEITRLDSVHDNKARAFLRYLEGFISGSEDPSVVEFCRMLVRICFPKGLDVITASYLDEAGWARVVDIKVTAPMRARLDGMGVGQQTMGDVFRAWIDAGITLGIRISERARLRAAVAKTGLDADELNITSVRSWWIRSTHNLVNAIDLMRIGPRDRDALLSPIYAAVADAARLRQGLPASDAPAPDPAPEEDPAPAPEEDPAPAPEELLDAEPAPDTEQTPDTDESRDPRPLAKESAASGRAPPIPYNVRGDP